MMLIKNQTISMTLAIHMFVENGQTNYLLWIYF